MRRTPAGIAIAVVLAGIGLPALSGAKLELAAAGTRTVNIRLAPVKAAGA